MLFAPGLEKYPTQKPCLLTMICSHLSMRIVAGCHANYWPDCVRLLSVSRIRVGDCIKIEVKSAQHFICDLLNLAGRVTNYNGLIKKHMPYKNAPILSDF